MLAALVFETASERLVACLARFKVALVQARRTSEGISARLLLISSFARRARRDGRFVLLQFRISFKNRRLSTNCYRIKDDSNAP